MELTVGDRNNGGLQTETYPGAWTWYYRSWANPEWRGFVQRLEVGGRLEARYRMWTNEKPIPSNEIAQFAHKILSITNGGRV